MLGCFGTHYRSMTMGIEKHCKGVGYRLRRECTDALDLLKDLWEILKGACKSQNQDLTL